MADDKLTRSTAEWQQQLDAEQFHVCREKGTERPFTGRYWDCKEDGTYHCSCCGNPLFASTTKFDSGTGWPSFWEPVSDDALRFEEDSTLGMRRVEVLCKRCDAHLGHVFPDGPQPTGQRYCINSVSLQLDED